MKKSLIATLIIAAAALFSLSASAEEKIVLKDGTVYVGHIKKQVPGKSLTFEVQGVEEKNIGKVYEDFPYDKDIRMTDVHTIVRSTVTSCEEASYSDVIMCDNGKNYMGVILSQCVADNSYIRLLQRDNTIVIIPSERMKRVIKNSSDDLLQTSSYWEHIVLNDGSAVIGLIVEQNYVVEEPFMKVKVPAGKDDQIIKMEKVMEIERIIPKEGDVEIEDFNGSRAKSNLLDRKIED